MFILVLFASDENTEDQSASHLCGFAKVYSAFKDSGVEFALASAAGGWPWTGPSARDLQLDGGSRSLIEDAAAREQLADTLQLDQVCIEDFDAAYCIGPPGAIWRSGDKGSVQAMLGRFLEAGKPVAIVPSKFDLAPHGAASGLLITGEVAAADVAAHTLLAAARALLGSRRRPSCS